MILRSLFLCLCLIANLAVNAHPICSSGSYPEIASPDLQICKHYNGVGGSCCNVTREAQVVSSWNAANPGLFSSGFVANNDSTHSPCDKNLLQIACLSCDPWENHRFTSTFAPIPNAPVICLDWCVDAVAATCGPNVVPCLDNFASSSEYCYNKTLVEHEGSTQGLQPAFGNYELPGCTDGRKAPNDPVGIYLSTKDGTIRRIQPNGANWVEQTNPLLLDQRYRTNNGGEQGLLTFEFDPTYGNTSCWLYVWYSDATGAQRNKLVRHWVDNCLDNNFFNDQVVNPDQECVYFEQQKQSQWHNGGRMFFDSKRCLYVGQGDGGQQNDGNGDAQNPWNYLGKIMRVCPGSPVRADPNACVGTNKYTIPAGNYYSVEFGNDGLGLPEIFSMGFRNPWNGYIDKDRIYQSDVGQNNYEEVNRLVGGENAGYPGFEGDGELKSTVAIEVLYETYLNGTTKYLRPLFDYKHEPNMINHERTLIGVLGNSISYCGIYHGSILPFEYRGGDTHVVADYMESSVTLVTVNETTGSNIAEAAVFDTPPIIRSITDHNNEMIFIAFIGYGASVKFLKFAPFYQPICGNYICEEGESCTNCAVDCPGLLTGPASKKYCCGNGECISGTCPGSCLNAPNPFAVAGNGYCEPTENCVNSPFDCPGHKSPGAKDYDWCCYGQKTYPACASPYDPTYATLVFNSTACQQWNDPCHIGNNVRHANGAIYEF